MLFFVCFVLFLVGLCVFVVVVLPGIKKEGSGRKNLVSQVTGNFWGFFVLFLP